MTEQNYNNEQKLRELLALVEFEEDGTVTINGNLLVKGHIKTTKNVTAFCETTFSKVPTLEAFTTLQSENENLRYENQRLSIINHYHRGE